MATATSMASILFGVLPNGVWLRLMAYPKRILLLFAENRLLI